MKTVILGLTLTSGFSPAATPSALNPDERQEMCAAECRARFFSIDPKRNRCLAACETEASARDKAASEGCRARGACR